MYKYSFIIPVYNCSEFLEECVESILNQSVKDFEILLIDDGSKDDSGTLCDKLAEKHDCVKAFHKKNGGAASARNFGIDNATGEYLLFIDGDDTIDATCLQSIDKAMSETNSEMIIFGMAFDFYKKGQLEKTDKLSCKYSGEFSYDSFIKDFEGYFNDNCLSSACNKVFVADIIQKNNLHFREEMILFEDFEFVLRYLQYIKKVYCIGLAVYHYRIIESKNRYYSRIENLCLLDEQIMYIHKDLINLNNGVTEKNIYTVAYSIINQVITETLISNVLQPFRFKKKISQIIQLKMYALITSGYNQNRLYSLLEKNNFTQIWLWSLYKRFRRMLHRIKDKMKIRGVLRDICRIIRRTPAKIANKIILFVTNIYLNCGKHRRLELDIKKAEEVIKSTYEPKVNFGIVEKPEKMGTLDLTVIIPVYNGEKYLKECIDTIINQKTSFKYEVICVNDGSTDSSTEILEEYSKNKNIIHIYQKNSGISASRNRGILEAKGKYIMFVDDDDLLDLNFINVMMSKAQSENADIVKCGYATLSENVERKRVIEHKDILLKDEEIVQIFNYSGYCWGTLYKRELFNSIEFPVGYWYEDILTRMLLYPQCKKFYYVGNVMCWHRFHKSNASAKVWNKTNVKALDQIYLVKSIINIAEKLDFDFSKEYCYAFQYEIGSMLYYRTLGLEENVKKALFLVACEINDVLSNKCSDYGEYGSLEQKALKKCFDLRDYSAWNTICKHV